jgi:hypothetical protein
MSVRRLFALILSFSLATALSRAAWAQDAQRADTLFREARDAARRGDYVTACAGFAESHRLDPAPGTLLNLGDCEEKRGKLAAAWTAFREAQHILPANDTRSTYALKRAASIEPKIARLTVALARGTPKDAHVMRDGVPLAPDAPAALDPGKHVLVLKATGHRDATIEITLREGEARTVDLVAGAEISEPNAPSETKPAPPEPAHVDGIAIGSFVAGGSAILTGVATGIMVLDAKSDYRSHCQDGYCDPEGSSAATRGKALGIVSPIAFAFGAACIAFGITRTVGVTVGSSTAGVRGVF